MADYTNKKVIVRCNRAGVFFGTLKEYDHNTREATLTDCRNIWYWDGAASIHQLATDGVTRPDNCKFTVVVPEMSVMEVIETIPCTDKAIKIIEEVSVWKR
ncbi:MAG: hypothetical protein IKJ78_05945 [Bacteroidales bacterium]|nr:hypothetical protein [Bacteroidales bacterium]